MNIGIFAHMNNDDKARIDLAPSATQPYDGTLVLTLSTATFFVTVEQMRDLRDLLVSSSLLALPEDAPEPECECVTVGDQADASRCEVHG